MDKLFNRSYTPLLCVILLLHVLVLSTSCGTNKSLAMLSDLPDSSRIALPQMQPPNTVIQPDDILEIKIAGKNPETVVDFNTKGGGSAGGTVSSAPVYLIDKLGNVELYKVGKVLVKGMTLDSAKNTLKQLIDAYLLDASVTMRFVNFRFSVLGEVRLPGSFNVQNEKVTILEALGYAGDMLQFAKKHNVRIVRDSSGFREVGLVNFTEKTLFTSPYYYLQRNDVLIIEADNNAKKVNERFARVSNAVSIITSIITLIFFVSK
ncbi:MAG TPA: polysaccharide biosynthesis/export family protein [Chitinophagaceae bacterium]|jgi:polysaccharide export outer membrane protein|nr:polysaccharide biosynthesis/export family protein [Chitinophagaceae bacterium]